MNIRIVLLPAVISLILMAACGQNNQAEPAAAAGSQADPAVTIHAAEVAGATLEDRLANGKKVYSNVCAACHQAEGQGMKGAFPPLAGSDMLAKEGGMLAVNAALNGRSGPVTVNGVDYNSIMPPVSYLSDNDIADVVTYVLHSWGNPGGEISAAQVTAARGGK